MFEYIDIHSHLYFPDYDVDREEEIENIRKAKIATVTIGVDFETSQKSIALTEKHDHLFASVGLHPDDVKVGDVFDGRIAALATHPKVVAIGECGLDYFKRSPEDIENIKKIQKEIFEAQINLALTVGKPLMLHIRPSDKVHFDAYKESLDILERYAATHGEALMGAAHFFVGDIDILKRFLNIGFSVTFGGVITFARDYDECVRYTPLAQMMSETDAPFVAPAPHRGKRNSPLYVPEVVKAIATIRGQEHEEVKATLLANGMRYMGLK